MKLLSYLAVIVVLFAAPTLVVASPHSCGLECETKFPWLSERIQIVDYADDWRAEHHKLITRLGGQIENSHATRAVFVSSGELQRVENLLFSQNLEHFPLGRTVDLDTGDSTDNSSVAGKDRSGHIAVIGDFNLGPHINISRRRIAFAEHVQGFLRDKPSGNSDQQPRPKTGFETDPCKRVGCLGSFSRPLGFLKSTPEKDYADNTRGGGNSGEYCHSPLCVRIARREFGPPVPFGWAALFLIVFCGGGVWLFYWLIERLTRPKMSASSQADDKD